MSRLPLRPTVFSFIGQAADSFGIRIQRVEQNRSLNQHSSRAHAHDFPQLIYCEQSGGLHRIGTEQQTVQAGDLFLIAPYEIHDPSNLGLRWVLQFTVDAITSPSTTPETALLSIYSNPLLLPFLRLAGTPANFLTVPPDQQSRWTDYFQSLEAELRLKQPLYQDAAKAYLRLILTEIVRLSGDILTPLQQPLLTEVFQLIDARFAEPLTLADIAQRLNRSAAYLTTSVRQLTGRTVLDWILERRMAEARKLLLQTDQTLSAIASQIGYRDTSSFVRQFRRLYNLTPGQWRRLNR